MHLKEERMLAIPHYHTFGGNAKYIYKKKIYIYIYIYEKSNLFIMKRNYLMNNINFESEKRIFKYFCMCLGHCKMIKQPRPSRQSNIL